MNSIHDKFVTSVQSMESRYKVFNVINEWIDHLKTAPSDLTPTELELPPNVLNEIHSFLRMEYDTWRLILILYYFRLSEMSEDTDFSVSMMVDSPEIDVSDELRAVEQLVEKDSSLNEIRKILEWLESNVSKQNEPDLLEKFINWEQTLDTLKRDSKLKIKFTKPMITQMDPDACFREGREVHPLDAEDDAKVMRGAYYYVRSGENQKAIDFLHESGHLATAAMFCGYSYSEKIQLFEPDFARTRVFNENEPETKLSAEPMDFMPMEALETSLSPQGFALLGNTERDVWKCIAFETCESNGLSKYARAALGGLCGHRRAMLNVAVTWEDKLWAHLKTLLDVKVEAELRKSSSLDLVPMPAEYWDQDSSILDCLNQIDMDEMDYVKNVDKIFHTVQKHVIMDDIEGLLETLRQGLTTLITHKYTTVIGHLFRFLTHLLLSLGIVGLPFDEDLMNTCTEAYIKVLVREGKLVCIPFYVEKLTAEKHIPVIVDQIQPEVESERDTIDFFMQAAYVNNLDILNIGIAIVSKLRDSQEKFDVESLHWITSCYRFVSDSREVMLAFLKNSILVIRKYLILNDLYTCNQIIQQVNESCINQVLSLSEEYEDTLIREYLCYSVYLEAEDAILLWQRSLRQKPAPNTELDSSTVSDFTPGERTLREKKRSEIKMSEEKWKKVIGHHLKNAIEKFFAVLMFDNGWLVDCVSPTNEEEFNSVKAVRRIILPKVVFVLIKLIVERNCLPTLRNFVYVLCEDRREILKEFTTAEITSIFKAVEEFIRPSSHTVFHPPK